MMAARHPGLPPRPDRLKIADGKGGTAIVEVSRIPGFRCVLVLSIAAAVAGAAEEAIPTVQSLRDRHLEVGERLDTVYFAAGRRVDIVACDLRELLRRGETLSPGRLERVEAVDARLREGWQALESRRAVIEDRLRALPRGAQALRVETLDPSPAPDAGWFMLRGAALEWPDGSRTEIPLAAFEGGRGPSEYAYECPPAQAVWVYGTNTAEPSMEARFDIERRAVHAAELALIGQDHDKPGMVRVRITFGGHVLHEGPNGFVKKGWSERRFVVPPAAFAAEPVSRGMPSLAADLESLAADVESFGNEAARIADEIRRDALTTEERTALSADRPSGPGWWRDHFLRGSYFEGLFYRSVDDKDVDDVSEWAVKMARDARINFLSGYLEWYVTRDHLARFLRANDRVGTPYVESAKLGDFPYTDAEGFASRTREYLRLWRDHPTMIGTEIDEPTARYEELQKAAAQGLFHVYLDERRTVLEAAGFEIPAGAWPGAGFANDTERALWVEWRLWGGRLMSDFLRYQWDRLAEQDRFLFTVIMSWPMINQPHLNSYAAVGQVLPMISTDIYVDSDVHTGFLLQLLRSAAADRCVFVPGAGYSDHSPTRFRRDLAVSMVHADGVCMWTWCYFDKYRAPRTFWRTAKDDRGRPLRGDWAPEYWEITREMYARMERADAFLARTESCAPVALLYCERAPLIDSAEPSSAAGYFENNYGVYAALVRRAAPFDALLLETTSPGDLARYRVVCLADARPLSSDQCETIRAWVRDGGILVSMGATSLWDAWGRPQPDFGIADVLGVSYVGEAEGPAMFETPLPGGDGTAVRVDAVEGESYVRVTPTTARVLAAWDTGDPAVLRNAFGKGACVMFTASRPGRFYYGGGIAGSGEGHEPATGMPAERRPGFPILLRAWVDSALEGGRLPVAVVGEPEGPRTLEVQLRRAGEAYVVHLLDWAEDREVRGLRLVIRDEGSFEVTYPTDREPRPVIVEGPVSIDLRPFRVHEMVVVRPMAS